MNPNSYGINNPMKYYDPTGHFVETAIDAISLGSSIVSMYKEPGIANAAFLAWDVVALLPFVPGSYAVKGSIHVASVFFKATKMGKKVTNGLEGLAKLARRTASAVRGSSKLAFKTGKAGEEYLLKMLGGQTQKYINTPLGRRFIDVFSDGVAHESKVGYASLTSFVKKQIKKDVYARDILGEVDDIVWHFFESEVTGKKGPSGPLKQYLTENGIDVMIH